MKKIMFVFAAVATVAACSKNSQSFDNQNLTPEENGAPVAVEFSSNVVAAVSAKSQGGVDAWDAAQNLHIYGYKRVSGGVDYSTTPFIDNVIAVSPAEGAADNSLAVYRPGTSNMYYYDGNYTYDFFGFYMDDLAVGDDDVYDASSSR